MQNQVFDPSYQLSHVVVLGMDCIAARGFTWYENASFQKSTIAFLVDSICLRIILKQVNKHKQLILWFTIYAFIT